MVNERSQYDSTLLRKKEILKEQKFLDEMKIYMKSHLADANQNVMEFKENNLKALEEQAEKVKIEKITNRENELKNISHKIADIKERILDLQQQEQQQENNISRIKLLMKERRIQKVQAIQIQDIQSTIIKLRDDIENYIYIYRQKLSKIDNAKLYLMQLEKEVTEEQYLSEKFVFQILKILKQNFQILSSLVD